MISKEKNIQKFKNVLSEIKVGSFIIKNRIFVSAHQPVLAKDGLPTEEYLQYHKNIAAGGAGLQITGAQSVHPTGMNEYNCLVNHDESIIPGYQKLANAVHEEGGKILAQLTHFGATGWTGVLEEPAWAPSPVASEIMRVTPHEMTIDEIMEVVESFGKAAYRAKKGGLDGVEITGAHGMLISAFLSGYANHRTDKYGGSLENRMRFFLEVIDCVHDYVGDDFIMGVRFSADEKVSGGIDITQAKKIAQRLELTKKVDYLNVISGTNLDRFQRWEHWPATPSPHGLFVNLAKQIKEVVNIPVFSVGRVTDPDLAEEIISEGFADMVAMTRGHIADPNIVKKIQENRTEDIRPCVGANYCIKQVLDGKPVRCIYNPEAGRAKSIGPILSVKEKKKIVVIGGGPAGLEAARVASIRGHKVEVFEKSDQIGGQLRLWAKSPAMNELQKSINWFKSQIQKLNIKIHFNTDITKEKLLELDADEIIIATGANSATLGSENWLPPLPIDKNSQVEITTPHEILNKENIEFNKAILWDHRGGEAGSQIVMSTAEYLIEKGIKIEIVAPTFTVGEDIHPTLRTPLYKRLFSKGVILKPNSEIQTIREKEVVIKNIYSDEQHISSNVDILVTWLGNRANDGIYSTLLNSGFENAYMIGDAVAPRTVESATYEGSKIARNI